MYQNFVSYPMTRREEEVEDRKRLKMNISFIRVLVVTPSGTNLYQKVYHITDYLKINSVDQPVIFI